MCGVLNLLNLFVMVWFLVCQIIYLVGLFYLVFCKHNTSKNASWIWLVERNKCLSYSRMTNLMVKVSICVLQGRSFSQFLFWVVLTNIIGFYCFRNMVLAERCVLLSAEILKSQSKYSEAAALLIRLTSEVSSFFHFFFPHCCPPLTEVLLGDILILVLGYLLSKIANDQV